MTVQEFPANGRSGAGHPSLASVARHGWLLAALAAMAIGGYARSVYQAGSPLWLDETFTGMFAANDGLGGVLRDVLRDVNAPLYHVVTYGFSQAFGLSNEALRAPSLMFGLLAPLLCLIPAPGLDRNVRFAWCALVALWLPALQYSLEARCYTMLLSLCIAQTTAFLWLIDKPTVRRAAVWTALASAAVLTHYFAAIVVIAQGLAYVWVHRARALRTWPALIVAAPGLVWVGLHASRLAAFSEPGVSWHPQFGWVEMARTIVFIFGSLSLVMSVGLAGLAMLAAARLRPEAAPPRAGGARGPGLVVAVGAAALGAFLVLAATRQIFFPRYLFPYIPALLLGAALAATRFSGAFVALPVAALAVGAVEAAQLPDRPWLTSRLYSIEAASSDLAAAGHKHLVFFFDHPTTRKGDVLLLERFGGFFVERAGGKIDVSPLIPKAGRDPNAALLALADRPDSAILWMYDLTVPLTQAIDHPPRIDQAPGWSCRNYAQRSLGVLACVRETPR